jgi:tRNA U34 5-methylaminomethyl-2-thiouridine-forming methyltransferase MnmC
VCSLQRFAGILSLDFTSIRKPCPDSCVIASDFVETLRSLPHEQRLAAAKQILGQSIVTLKQVKHLLKDWQHIPAARVQLLVLAFARIVEYRGYFQLCDLLTKEEFALLQRRLGFHNIYDPFSSVHYFEFNLANAEHREVVAHIVRLAVLEPGGVLTAIAAAHMVQRALLQASNR